MPMEDDGCRYLTVHPAHHDTFECWPIQVMELIDSYLRPSLQSAGRTLDSEIPPTCIHHASTQKQNRVVGGD